MDFCDDFLLNHIYSFVLFDGDAANCAATTAVCRRFRSKITIPYLMLESNETDRIPLLDDFYAHLDAQQCHAQLLLLPRCEALEVRRAVWHTHALDAAMRWTRRALLRLYIKSRKAASPLVCSAVGGALLHRVVQCAATRPLALNTLHVDSSEADLPTQSDAVSLRVLSDALHRSLRRLTLRHVLVCDAAALGGKLALERLDLKQVRGVAELTTSPAFVGGIETHAHLMRALSVDARPTRQRLQPLDALLDSVGRHLRALDSLSLSFHTFAAANALDALAELQQLTALYLLGCRSLAEDGGVDVQCVAKLPRLRVLDLYACAVPHEQREAQARAIGRCVSLRSLMMFENAENRLLDELRAMPQLVDFYCDRCSLTSETAVALSTLPELRYLHLNAFDQQGLSAALKLFGTQLYAIDFAHRQNARAIDDSVIALMCERAPNLYFCDFDGASKPTTACLASLARLPHLHHVNLRDAIQVEPFVLNRFLQYLLDTRRYQSIERPLATSNTAESFPIDNWRQCVRLGTHYFANIGQCSDVQVEPNLQARTLDELGWMADAASLFSPCSSMLSNESLEKLRMIAEVARENSLDDSELELLPCGTLLELDTPFFEENFGN